MLARVRGGRLLCEDTDLNAAPERLLCPTQGYFLSCLDSRRFALCTADAEDLIANLSKSLNDPATKAEATRIIQSLFENTDLLPNTPGVLDIELVGKLAGLLCLGAS